MHEHLPWAAFTLAVGLSMLWGQTLPEVFARRRFGFRRPVQDLLLWPNLLGILALFVWPFVAASAIEWDRRAPSLLTILLIALGCVVTAWVLCQVLGWILVAMIGSPPAEDGAAGAAADLLRRFDLGLTVAVAAAVALAFWTLTAPGQQALCGRYYC